MCPQGVAGTATAAVWTEGQIRGCTRGRWMSGGRGKEVGSRKAGFGVRHPTTAPTAVLCVRYLPAPASASWGCISALHSQSPALTGETKKGLKRLACGAIHSKPFSLLLVDCHACLQKTRQVCPLLLRCFWTQQRHRRGEDYSNINNLPRDELQIYTWCVCCVHTYTRRDSVCS